MNMQGSAGQTYYALSGTKYAADPVSGIVLNVANGDQLSLLNFGCTPISASRSTLIDLLNVKNADGSALAAAAAAGTFGRTITAGSVFNLIGEVATSNTKTDSCIVDFVLPNEYVAGHDLIVGVNCKEAGGAATVKTLALNAYKLNEAGGEGADLCTTAATPMGTAAGTLNFAVTGATLNPGDILQLKLTTVITEAAAGAVHAEINAITVT